MRHRSDFPRRVVEWSDVRVEMPDGVRLSLRIWLPEDAEINPVPAILEHLPYRKRDGTIARDELTHPYFAGHGYACVRVDMRGNGDSEGLMADEYTQQEWDDAIAVMEWVCDQPWCTGNWGMMGISWGGFNGLQVASLQPKGLGAVISLCSSVDRYADDIHYKGGCHLGTNLSWAAQMLAYSSRPPDPMVVGDSWRDMWLERLNAQPFLLETWLQHQNRDDYWKHGSICEDFGRVEVPVLAIGGWHDGYRNTPAKIVEALPNAKALVGPWNHKYPHFAGPEPRIGFLQEALRWWDRWLKGRETGVQDEPRQRVYLMDSVAPERWVDARPGRWIGLDEMAPMQTFYLGPEGLTETQEDCGLDWEFRLCGGGTGTYFPYAFGPELPGDQQEDDGISLCFDRRLDAPLEIVGAPSVQLDLVAGADVQQVAVRLCDVHPDGRSTLVSHGFLNLTHHKSHETPQRLGLHTVTSVSVTLDQCAYVLPAGHNLRVAVSGSYWPFLWPSPNDAGWTLQAGRIEIPVLDGATARSVGFPQPEAAPAWAATTVRPTSMTRDIVNEGGKSWLVIETDHGSTMDMAHGLVTGTTCREEWICATRAVEAEARIKWETETRRNDWSVRTVCTAEMTCDESTWYPRARIEAYEGDELVLVREYSLDIPRNLM